MYRITHDLYFFSAENMILRCMLCSDLQSKQCQIAKLPSDNFPSHRSKRLKNMNIDGMIYL